MLASDATVFFDGEFKEYGDVRLGLLTHALLYGTGCFEGIRGYWNNSRSQMYLLQPHAHYDRLQDSARILLLDLPYMSAELVEVTAELIRRNGLNENCYVRPVLFKSGEAVGVPYRDVPTSLAITVFSFGDYLDSERGIRCKVSSWHRVPDGAIPVRAKVTGVYINSSLAKAEALEAGYDEAIQLDSRGHVAEGAAENIFIKRGDEWITPPVTSDILEGITRRMVMQLVRDELSLSVVEREIDRSELYLADEILLCGTGAEIVPVLDVDGRKIGTGAVGESTSKLISIFGAAARGDDDRYASWLHAVS